MLFVIDQSVAAVFDADSATLDDIAGLNNLFLGAVEGNHRIIGSRTALQKLASRQELSDKTRLGLSRTLSRVAQDGLLYQKLSCYGRVVAGTGATLSSMTTKGQRIITFPLQWFDNSAKIQPTTLLSENLSDVGVLTKMAEVGSVLAKLSYVQIKMIPAHGGGSTTGPVLASIVSRNQICLCIVDSDRAAPSGALGQTASAVQIFKQESTYPITGVAETFGRDLENALPTKFYNDVYRNAKCTNLVHIVLGELERSKEFTIRWHLDIEKGLRLRTIFNHPVGSHERVYWDTNLPIVMRHVGVDATAFPCLSAGACSSNPCGCSVVVGNPANILDAFVTWSSATDRFLLEKLLDESVRAEWQRIGTLVASWCIGDDRLRS